jgi:hypothetical protein
MGDIGTELQRSRPRKTAILRTGDAQSDAQAQLQAMAVAWSRLPQASRQRIAQVIRDEFEQAAVAERRTLG